mgnify:CR=1 FL=1
MLKLTLRPGEFIDIGDNVRVIFSGGSANNIHLLVDAPREINIARSSAAKKKDTTEPGAGRYYKESGISDEAQKEIVSILMREKRKMQPDVHRKKRKMQQYTITAVICG